MDDRPPATVPKPCSVCAAPGGSWCTKCKSRHYCSRACQRADWCARGHKAQCKQLATARQDRLAALQTAAASLTVENSGVVPAAAAAARDGAFDWRGGCAICLDALPLGDATRTFYECCCQQLCTGCHVKCREYDDRCPLCRSLAPTSAVERLRRLQLHVDKGNATAQLQLADACYRGCHPMGLKKSVTRAAQLYEAAAAQGHADAQFKLGSCYERGDGVKLNLKTAAQWLRRAAERGHPDAQNNLGNACHEGEGVAQSYAEAVKWFRLAAAQGNPDANICLGACYAEGHGVPLDLHESLRFYKRAAATGDPEAALLAVKVSRALARE